MRMLARFDKAVIIGLRRNFFFVEAICLFECSNANGLRFLAFVE